MRWCGEADEPADDVDNTEECAGDLSYEASSESCVCEAGLTRCGDTCVDTEEVCAVAIDDFAFSPASLTVVEGTTVVWTNVGTETHTVTSGTPEEEPGAVFSSGDLAPEDSTEVTFNDVGAFPYYCEPHAESMRAEVVVLAAD
ncbi:hypothetical protein FRC98_15700 [Lujinxingia vulgaris]|uniref:Blue (type 1) copper domain-containing protein n=1 Tax=Lujinxingia vulgaris TaxID=2600176 RepID=A0A5C6X1H8_9DELT|nr:plastocyanin/azurin family copper-binding protein [Lujinxingia vulgaris]TXD35649.1 hypothetical protein FRC98_15700 [Lujinxingia vulgaris]